MEKYLFIGDSHQGGRSCTGARVAPAEKFGLGQNFKPKHMLFCRELRFIAIYAPFGDLWANYMVYIAYFTELILQIWDYTQKRRI